MLILFILKKIKIQIFYQVLKKRYLYRGKTFWGKGAEKNLGEARGSIKQFFIFFRRSRCPPLLWFFLSQNQRAKNNRHSPFFFPSSLSPTTAPLTLLVPSSLISLQTHSSPQVSPYFPQTSHTPDLSPLSRSSPSAVAA